MSQALTHQLMDIGFKYDVHVNVSKIVVCWAGPQALSPPSPDHSSPSQA